MKKEEYDKVIEEKEKVLDNLKKIYEDDPSPDNRKLILDTIAEITKNQDFNTNTTIKKTDDILSDTLKLGDKNTTLTEEEIDKVSDIIDNTFEYFRS